MIEKANAGRNIETARTIQENFSFNAGFFGAAADFCYTLIAHIDNPILFFSGLVLEQWLSFAKCFDETGCIIVRCNLRMRS